VLLLGSLVNKFLNLGNFLVEQKKLEVIRMGSGIFNIVATTLTPASAINSFVLSGLRLHSPAFKTSFKYVVLYTANA